MRSFSASALRLLFASCLSLGVLDLLVVSWVWAAYFSPPKASVVPTEPMPQTASVVSKAIPVARRHGDEPKEPMQPKSSVAPTEPMPQTASVVSKAIPVARKHDDGPSEPTQPSEPTSSEPLQRPRPSPRERKKRLSRGEGTSLSALEPQPSPAARSLRPSRTTRSVSGQERFFFRLSRADLSKEASKRLRRLASFFRREKTPVIWISASTDSSGSPSFNRQLRQERALAIQKALLAYGLSSQRLRIRHEPIPTSRRTPHLLRCVVLRW